ncbi:integrase [Riemerella anatipestifer]|nr:integrase [Riemerella anatipestifer]
MANIIFYLRGTKEPKKVYLRYRPNRDFNLSINTPFVIHSENWDDTTKQWDTSQIVKGAKTVETKKQNAEILDFNKRIETFKLDISNQIDNNLNLTAPQLKEHLKDFILKHYFAHKLETKKKYTIPDKLDALIDYYIQFRSVEDKTQGKKPISANTIKKYRGLKSTLMKFNKNLIVTDINNIFRNKLVKWFNGQGYTAQTQTKYLKDIKMLCKFAETEHNISKDVLSWKIDRNPDNVTKGLYLNFDKLATLETLDLTGSLDEVRDWLLISCYTALRVSELFSLDTANIVEDPNGRKFIKVIEKKNRNAKDKGIKYTALLPKVVDIMNKRGGKFPKVISEPYYNRQLKKLCKIAGFDEVVQSAKIEATENGNRRIEGEYPFYELVTSHIGRQTSVTLFGQFMDTETMQMMTNHHDKTLLEHYNKIDIDTKQLQKAKKVYEAFKNMNITPEQLN